MRSRARTDERGATLVFIALALTGVLAVATLAIDGGKLFTARRQTQNATDVAALAGASALFNYQYLAATGATRDPTTIWTTVQDKLSQNTAATSQSCVLVTTQGTPAVDLNGNVEPCATATDPQLLAAAGVQVGGSQVQQGTFSGVIGVNHYSASSSSTATLQPLGSTGSPFIICGAANLGWNFLKPDDTIDINYAKTHLINIPLQWSQLGQGYDCNAPTSKFKGLASQDAGPVTPGDYESITNGNRYSAVVANAVAGQVACPPDLNATPITVPCDLVVPVADGANTDPSNPQLHIVNFAIFQVTPASGGGVKYTGTFVAPTSLASQGSGVFGASCQVGGQVCVAKLVA